MIRLLPFFLGCFVMPILAYAAWLLAKGYHPFKLENWRDAPWRWFFITGCAILMITLIAFNHYGGGNAELGYSPARMENGKLIQAK